MTVEERLNERREARIAAGREACTRLHAHEHFRDWLAVADALVAIREEAMDQAHTNIPQGPPYRAAIKAIRKRELWTEKFDSATHTACYWLIDHLPAVTTWRETIGFEKRDLWNHPVVVKRNYERMNLAEEKKKAARGEAALSPLAQARQLAAQLQDENAKLKRELARAKDDGSLFNLREESADIIGRIIVEHVSDHKAEEIAKAIRARAKARQTRRAHAG